jgi:hypothetical protein
LRGVFFVRTFFVGADINVRRAAMVIPLEFLLYKL